MAFKSYYRKQLLHCIMTCMGNKANLSVLLKRVSLLDACKWIHLSMKEVKSSTVVKCFAHCSVTGIDITEDNNDEGIPLFCTSNDIPHLLEIQSNSEDTLQPKAIYVKCHKVNQTSITSFFRKCTIVGFKCLFMQLSDIIYIYMYKIFYMYA